ncbi:hypothetical protein HanPI659440_Chr03g0100781 [Helianthus annuus]|nr:hypothetical protein HanPI659440_Chr03g0100781 [Helianthus annuus]
MKFETKTVPKKHVEKPARGRGKKKPEGSVAPPLVSQVAGISRSCYRRYTDYVVVSDTLEGLGLPGGGAAAGGTSAGSKPAGEKKRKPEEKDAASGVKKRRRIQTKRSTETQGEDFSSLFDVPSSPPHDTAADAGVNKECAGPFVKVVSEPSVRVEDTGRKGVAHIFDMVDSSDNLISLNDTDDLNLKFLDVDKQKYDAEKHKTPAAEKASSSAFRGVGFEGPPIQPGESKLEYYYRTYTQDRSTSYHRPSIECYILGVLGTPFEVGRARVVPRELRINQLSSMLVGSYIVANAIMEDYKVMGRKEEETARLRVEAEELVKAAREGAERLEREKAAFEKHKQTEEWVATAEFKQVRTLAKLLSDERKSWKETLSNERKTWKESWAKQNENLFRVRQELANVKAANATLVKEKAAAEAAVGKAREAEARVAKALEEATEMGARAAKALEEANADRFLLNTTVGSLQNREAMLAEVTARATEAERRASEAVEARDSLTSSFNQLETDREWMRCHGIGHIVKAILDAPETAAGIDLIKQRARDAGFKAGYNRCISHMNILAQGKYTVAVVTTSLSLAG